MKFNEWSLFVSVHSITSSNIVHFLAIKPFHFNTVFDEKKYAYFALIFDERFIFMIISKMKSLVIPLIWLLLCGLWTYFIHHIQMHWKQRRTVWQYLDRFVLKDIIWTRHEWRISRSKWSKWMFIKDNKRNDSDEHLNIFIGLITLDFVNTLFQLKKCVYRLICLAKNK